MVENQVQKEGRTVYELGFLLLSSIPEEKVENVFNSIRALVTKEGGEEIDSEAPIKQPLAYQMSKTVGASKYVLEDAYIGWVKFELEPSSVSAIKAAMEKLEEVLRFLIIKAPRATTFTFASVKALMEEGEEKVEDDVEVASGGAEEMVKLEQ